jgi:hypothetical protein
MMRTLAWTVLVAGSLASTASAVDGALEINQTCASGPGCFAGDGSGYPVQITAPGSYRLTSNLIAPNQNTNLVDIAASGVHLDLNGFALVGTNGYSGPGASCTAPGSGAGVSASSTSNDVSVANGHARGLGSSGIRLLGANSRVADVTAEHNCGRGIGVGFASLVVDSIARGNAGFGIHVDRTSRVINCVADVNGMDGITGPNGDVAVEGCVANANGIDGVFVGANSSVRGCVALGNGDDGIAALASSRVTESIANGNTDRGITVLGTVGGGDSTAVGPIVANGNTGSSVPNLSGGTAIACNLVGGVRSCPP